MSPWNRSKLRKLFVQCLVWKLANKLYSCHYTVYFNWSCACVFYFVNYTVLGDRADLTLRRIWDLYSWPGWDNVWSQTGSWKRNCSTTCGSIFKLTAEKETVTQHVTCEIKGKKSCSCQPLVASQHVHTLKVSARENCNSSVIAKRPIIDNDLLTWELYKCWHVCMHVLPMDQAIAVYRTNWDYSFHFSRFWQHVPWYSSRGVYRHSRVTV